MRGGYKQPWKKWFDGVGKHKRANIDTIPIQSIILFGFKLTYKQCLQKSTVSHIQKLYDELWSGYSFCVYTQSDVLKETDIMSLISIRLAILLTSLLTISFVIFSRNHVFHVVNSRGMLRLKITYYIHSIFYSIMQSQHIIGFLLYNTMAEKIKTCKIVIFSENQSKFTSLFSIY